MTDSNVKLLEALVLTFINSKYKEIPPSEQEFREEAAKFRQDIQSSVSVTNDEFEDILARLMQTVEIRLDTGIYVSDRNNGHQSWLPAKRADFDFFFWDRYRKYLEQEKHWNPRVTSTLGRISDEILDLCGDPAEDRFAIKGLILGDVQSGKTANYTAICNKAADTGYRIIIILSGLQENLRIQTQERLDAEFSGRKSEYFLDPKAKQGIKNRANGVGKYGKPNNPSQKIASFTSVTKDFDSGVLRSNNLGIESVNCPVLFVVKKNKRILNNLIKWLSDNNTHNAAGEIDLPLLLIDDEADNASVNTKDPDSQPAAINDCIRRLLKLFSKTTYLGITATPFANIFIDPEAPDDLFPADFIYALSAPTNYIGADRVFGEDGDCGNMLIPIKTSDLENCFPPNHKKDFAVSELPDDLYEAASYFLLVNAIRDIRGDVTQHRSMMVHISLYTDVQNQITEKLSGWLEQVQSDLRNYSRLSTEETEKIDSIRKLHSIWEKYSLSAICGKEWVEVLRDYLYKAVAPIEVKSVNKTTSAASLNYSRYEKTGLRVIAVGGNSLSRGLTLEGLCVTYFHRTTKMYDTLMQMGRWFGYRPNYADLVKVWMSEEAIEWYGQITKATAELKEEIIRMRNAQQTPREFGLKVRQDPGSLIVTARNKMRTAKNIECPISVSGRRFETPRLKASRQILDENEKVFKDFVNLLAENGCRLNDNERTKGNYYWEHVPSELISQLLQDFSTDPLYLRFNGPSLSDYIASRAWPNGWDVVLMAQGDGCGYPGGLQCGNETLRLEHTERRRIVITRSSTLSVNGASYNRVGSGGWTRIGLTNVEIENAKRTFIRETGKNNVREEAYLIEGRAPILALHVLKANYSGNNSQLSELPSFLFALGVGFPKTECATEMANYKVNLVELKNLYGSSDESDEEEEF